MNLLKRFSSIFAPFSAAAALVLVACGESPSFTVAQDKEATQVSPNTIFQSSTQVEDSANDSAGRQKSSSDGNREIGQKASEGTQKVFASIYERSFSLQAKSEKVTATVELPDGSTSQSITLSYTEQSESKTFEQIERPLLTRSFTQGAAGQPGSETFSQSEIKGVLDVLIVVDNSGSMRQEQTNLSTKLSVLLSEIAEANWKIGVVTTDPNNPCMRGLIEKGQPNAAEAFRAAVAAGINGSGNEQGIRQAVVGLSCPAAEWLRPASSLAVLIVSDEDNCSSNGVDCQDKPWSQTSYLTSYLTNSLARNLGVDARVYGLIAHPSDTMCTTAKNVGTQYARVVEETRGSWGSICADDYTATLAQISRDMKSILKSQFVLKNAPAPGTLNVQVKSASGVTLPAPYTLNGPVVTFAVPPPAGSTISVTYTTRAEAQLNEFQLGVVPAAGTEKLTLVQGDTVLSGSGYQILADKLVFAQAPAPGTRINIVFRQDLPLGNEFMLGQNVDANSIVVNVNDAKRTDIEFQAASGLLKLKTPAPDGAKITVAYKTKVPNLSYTLAKPIGAGSLVSFGVLHEDKITPVATGITLAGPMVSITDPALFVPGRTIVIKSKPVNMEPALVPLAPGMIASSLIVKTAAESCSVGKEILLSGNALSVNCGVQSGLKLEIEYQTQGQPVRSFALTQVAETPAGTWKAFLDGRELLSSEFTVSNETFTLQPQVEIGQNSVVTLKLVPRES